MSTGRTGEGALCVSCRGEEPRAGSWCSHQCGVPQCCQWLSPSQARQTLTPQEKPNCSLWIPREEGQCWGSPSWHRNAFPKALCFKPPFYRAFFLSFLRLPNFWWNRTKQKQLQFTTSLQFPWFSLIIVPTTTKLDWRHLTPFPDSTQMHSKLSNHWSHPSSLLLLTGIKRVSFYRFCRT